jgi:hypothetical protein
MAVPDTPTGWGLVTVIDEIEGSGGAATNSLLAAFTNSIDNSFDPQYSGSKDRLTNFRNYNAIVNDYYLRMFWGIVGQNQTRQYSIEYNSPITFGTFDLVGTVRFQEFGSISNPYTGNCVVLRQQDVPFSYTLQYPYENDDNDGNDPQLSLTSYMQSINPYNFNGTNFNCSDPVSRLGIAKPNFDTFTNSPIIINGNRLTISSQIEDF